MPASLDAYWTAWNETELEQIAEYLDQAVVDDIVWNDPRDSFVGRAALHDAITKLRTSKPDYRFKIVSEIDGHNDRYRYRWDMVRNERTLMQGLDVATLDPQSGLIVRVDGFFGALTPLLTQDSGVPTQHHA